MKKLLALLAFVALPALAQRDNVIEPFRIAGNLYYVGGADVTSFLITTPNGHILLDGGYDQMAAGIAGNIEKLGFRARDVKILLSSHAHLDHAGGLAELKRRTGATFYAAPRDVGLLTRGGLDDPQFGEKYPYPPVEPDRLLRDGQRITLGGTTLVAHFTPGHTAGCVTWSMRLRAGGKTHDVVFMGSSSVPSEYRLIGHPLYPDAVADYRHSFTVLKALPCDIPLGSHAGFFDMEKKRPTGNFVDPQGCRELILGMERRFEERVAGAAK